MVFLSWTRPSPKEQKDCINKCMNQWSSRVSGCTLSTVPSLSVIQMFELMVQPCLSSFIHPERSSSDREHLLPDPVSDYLFLRPVEARNTVRLIEARHLVRIVEAKHLVRLVETRHLVRIIEARHLVRIIEARHLVRLVEARHLVRIVEARHPSSTSFTRSGTFNYDVKYRGATAKSLSTLKEDTELSSDGFVINHSKIMVGTGSDAYEKGKTALKTWRHFGLSWAFVDPKTPIENGMKFCVCLKEFFPWVRMPLQVVYVNETKSRKANIASFGFGAGTLSGHLLSGEERFAIEMDGDKQVWYEILSFSKPAHALSVIGYPYVLLRQKYFAHQSSEAVKKFVSSN